MLRALSYAQPGGHLQTMIAHANEAQHAKAQHAKAQHAKAQHAKAQHEANHLAVTPTGHEGGVVELRGCAGCPGRLLSLGADGGLRLWDVAGARQEEE